MDPHRIEVERCAAADRDGGTAGRLVRIGETVADAGAAGRGSRDSWNPPYCGELDMRIARDGTWHYKGSPIRRRRMVRLFASVLRREADGAYYLVTPAEKFRISVDDAPFIAAEMDVIGQGRNQAITFRSNVGDVAVAGPDHELRFESAAADDGLKPYVHMRDGLDALVARPLVYDLVELAEERLIEGESRLGVWSSNTFFEMGGAEALMDR